MSDPAIILNGDQIYLEELVRENARLTIQHEADGQRILALSDRVEQLERETGLADEALVARDRAQERVRTAEAALSQAVADLRFVMTGGDPCKVCAVKCTFGAGECEPVWRGTDARGTEEGAGR